MLKQNLLATAVLSVTMGLLSVSSANASEAASANSAAAAPAPNVLSQLCLPQEFGGVADGKNPQH